MQHRQHTDTANTLATGRVPNTHQYPIVPKRSRVAARRNIARQKWVGPSHPVKESHQTVTEIRPRVFSDGHSRQNPEPGLGVFYEAQEEAARRIAQRLHDESAQMLATVFLKLAEIARDCPESMVHKIDHVVKQLFDVCEQIRGLSHELRPLILEQLGLKPALQSLLNGFTERSGLKLVLVGTIPKLSLCTETVLYRVVQEALSNVVRHAGATGAVVTLSSDKDMVCCTVVDDGPGVTSPEQQESPVHGLGLVGIHECVAALKGQCKIKFYPNQGMELKVEIPL